MMNRNQRIGYLGRIRKDSMASLCPACKRKTRHFTVPSKDGDGKCDIVCEYCEKIVKVGMEGFKPYMPIRLTKEIMQ